MTRRRAWIRFALVPTLVLGGLGASAAPTASAIRTIGPQADDAAEAPVPVPIPARAEPIRDAPRRAHPVVLTPVAVPFECVVHLAEAKVKAKAH